MSSVSLLDLVSCFILPLSQLTPESGLTCLRRLSFGSRWTAFVNLVWVFVHAVWCQQLASFTSQCHGCSLDHLWKWRCSSVQVMRLLQAEFGGECKPGFWLRIDVVGEFFPSLCSSSTSSKLSKSSSVASYFENEMGIPSIWGNEKNPTFPWSSLMVESHNWFLRILKAD